MDEFTQYRSDEDTGCVEHSTEAKTYTQTASEKENFDIGIFLPRKSDFVIDIIDPSLLANASKWARAVHGL